jgi:hypothetical protein
MENQNVLTSTAIRLPLSTVSECEYEDELSAKVSDGSTGDNTFYAYVDVDRIVLMLDQFAFPESVDETLSSVDEKRIHTTHSPWPEIELTFESFRRNMRNDVCSSRTVSMDSSHTSSDDDNSTDETWTASSTSCHDSQHEWIVFEKSSFFMQEDTEQESSGYLTDSSEEHHQPIRLLEAFGSSRSSTTVVGPMQTMTTLNATISRHKARKCQTYLMNPFLGMCAVLLCCVVGVVWMVNKWSDSFSNDNILPIAYQNKTTYYESKRLGIKTLLGVHPVVGSAQHQAIEFMVNQDLDVHCPMQSISFLLLQDRQIATKNKVYKRLVQRYVLLVLYFSNGDFRSIGGWGTPTGRKLHECLWSGVRCSNKFDEESVTGIEINERIGHLYGTMPTDLGFLTTLGKFESNITCILFTTRFTWILCSLL